MTPAHLDEQGVNCSNLNSPPPAQVPDLSCFNVVFSIWLEERKGCKSLQELGPGLGSGKALKEFLKDEASGKDLIGAEEGMAERVYLRRRLLNIPTERQRPDACVDKQAHRLRPRSAL